MSPLKVPVGFTLLLFLTGSAFAASDLPTAIQKLSPRPLFSDRAASPYTHSIDENLIRTFAEEMRLAKREVPAMTSKREKKRLIHATLDERNRVVRAALDKSPAPGLRTDPATRRTIDAVFSRLSTNPVSRVDAVTKYDRRGDVGFCFGRAMMVHYLLLESGVSQNQIAKIFAVGKLRYKNQLWEFHMATMVRGEKGQWWVIDSLFEKPLPHGEWMARATTFGINQEFPEVRFYVTDPRKFQPGYAEYRRQDLTIPELEPYFTELFQSLAVGR